MRNNGDTKVHRIGTAGISFLVLFPVVSDRLSNVKTIFDITKYIIFVPHAAAI